MTYEESVLSYVEQATKAYREGDISKIIITICSMQDGWVFFFFIYFLCCAEENKEKININHLLEFIATGLHDELGSRMELIKEKLRGKYDTAK